MKLYALKLKLNDKTKSFVCPYSDTALTEKLKTFTYPKQEGQWFTILFGLVFSIAPLLLLGRNKQSDLVCRIFLAVFFLAGYLIPCISTLSELLWHQKYSEKLAEGKFTIAKQQIDELECKIHHYASHSHRKIYFIRTGSLKILVERECYARLKKSEYMYLLLDGDNVFGLIPVTKQK